MDAIFFGNQQAFREWLAKNHDSATEIWVGYYKKGTPQHNLTWPQSVDQALCFGWIDGIRKSIDESRYCNRFTPRKPGSNWSLVNIRKAEEMIACGLMMPAGLEAFSKRKTEKSGVYSFENGATELPAQFLSLFKLHPEAWSFFEQQSASYRKTAIHWILSAKQETTRLSRLEKVKALSSDKRRLFG